MPNLKNSGVSKDKNCIENLIETFKGFEAYEVSTEVNQISLDKETAVNHVAKNKKQAAAAVQTKSIIKVRVPVNNFLEAAALLVEKGAFLLTMAATDQRQLQRGFEVYAVFSLTEDAGADNELLAVEKGKAAGDKAEAKMAEAKSACARAYAVVEIVAGLDPNKPVYPSLTPIVPAAHWLEREIKDMFGIVPLGHPDLRRVAVHPDWPKDVFPLRKDFISGTKVPRVAGEMEFCPVEGHGLYQVPVGPVHAGIIEPGHFRFFTFGEDVINLQAQLFYTHRGVEKAAEGKHFNDAALVAERICGVCSASHAEAYAQAIEAIAGISPPKRALYIRTILLEMERLYNHVGDIGNMCAGIGFAFGISRGAILKEQVMRMNMRLAGHRYLRGIVLPGGARKDLKEMPAIALELGQLKKDLKELTVGMLSSHALIDRMKDTGILPREAGVALGAVGPPARAAGIDRDLRRDLPHGAYGELKFTVPLQQRGDVLCRLQQRIDETQQTFSLLQQAFDKLSQTKPGNLAVEIPPLTPYVTGVGYTESARGADVHWVMSGPDNTVYRYMVRSASHCNWPVVPLCVPGNIVPDFPLINKSFELCYACLDR